MGFDFDKTYEWKDIPLYFECVCGIFLQLMLLIAFIKDPLKCFRNSAVYLVANLSIVDMSVCVRGLLTIVLDPETTSMEYMNHSTVVASSIAMFSIAVDRCLLVTHPIKHRIFVSNKKMILWVALIWLLSFTESIKQAIMNGETSYDDLVRVCFYLLIVMWTLVFYTVTLKSLKKQSNRLDQLQNNNTAQEHRAQKLRILNEKRFVETVIIIACIYFLTILPNALFTQFEVFRSHEEEENTNGSLDRTLFAIWIVNFVINPIIYIWRLPKYRKTFCIIFCCRKYN